jgi:hypothetical protein
MPSTERPKFNVLTGGKSSTQAPAGFKPVFLLPEKLQEANQQRNSDALDRAVKAAARIVTLRPPDDPPPAA